MFWEGEIIIYLYVICILTDGKRVRCNDDKHVGAAEIYRIKEDAHPMHTTYTLITYIYVEKEDAQMVRPMKAPQGGPRFLHGT